MYAKYVYILCVSEKEVICVTYDIVVLSLKHIPNLFEAVCVPSLV